MLGHSIQRFITSMGHRSHFKRAQGRTCWSVDKWRLLAMMTSCFGSGFATSFFIISAA
ncbi:cytochrome c oxidase subunit 7C, mitochondrial-like [Ochotona curzoniae]|uniref:cytochrome c oxidase subunit 7C, mitochondrial-like n=1 Tax=Ochotona curzoniae TaxID=130825 RepID=UPI001B346B74|nr:cytochrome c oxidase subunit 7C, mitochondrial-like [Ochotona curzoniae]